MKRLTRGIVCGLALAAAAALPAAAQDYVGGEQQVRGGEATRPRPAPDNDARGLPITGGDLAGLAVLGAAAVGTGTVLVRRARRAA